MHGHLNVKSTIFISPINTDDGRVFILRLCKCVLKNAVYNACRLLFNEG